MLKDITDVEVLDGHRLRLRFEDGIEGVVDLARTVSFTGVFEPLKDRAYFARVRVLPEYGTIAWPNGADLDPDVLYSLVRESLPPDYGPENR
jgi:hypothetical protein